MNNAKPLYRVWVEGAELPVHATPSCHFVLVGSQGTVRIRVEPLVPQATCVVRPWRLGLTPERDGEGCLTFDVTFPETVILEFDGDLKTPLFLLSAPELYPLPVGDVLAFSPGFHNAGTITMHSGQTLYLAPGAWVQGIIQADSCDDLRICGSGVLDAVDPEITDDKAFDRPRHNAILLSRCKNVQLEGITILNSPGWHVVPVACEQVVIQQVNIIGHLGTGDGIDVVGCRHVRIQDCFVRVKDDCVAIKAVDYQFPFGETDVIDVVVERCVFWNDTWGNVMEIGYETRCEEICDITFRDIDVVHCEYEGWQSGGVFTIHNGDRAHVHHVLYEDIRIEGADEKLIDFKILDSRYSKDRTRGKITDITLRRVQVVSGPFPVSVLRGWEEGHLIERVRIEDLVILGQRITDWREARMVVELTKGLEFLQRVPS